MNKVKISLAWQILIALILGVVVGTILHNQPDIQQSVVNNFLKPAGQIFINLIWEALLIKRLRFKHFLCFIQYFKTCF